MMDIETGKIISLRRTEDEDFDAIRARRILSKNLIVSFNGNGYDIPLISMAIGGSSCKSLKTISDKIVKAKNSWAVIRNADIVIPEWDHIDIMNVAPGKAGLKLYGGRIGAQKLQDLPYEPDKVLTPEEMNNVESYCGNDLELTKLLYENLKPQIELRKQMSAQYGMDLRSKGDAQIAESVLKHELEAANVIITRPHSVSSGDAFGYTPPKWIAFKSEMLNTLLADAKKAVFKVQHSGSVAIPEILSREIQYDGATYKIGIGGLHSSETSQAIVCGDDEVLFDADFTSYYPSIILGERYYPKHLGKRFLTIYKSIVERRVNAKKEKDMVTANSLKIVINSSFGKFGNKYSALYSPDLLIHVTLTGQLSLLMLIEDVTLCGGTVVSANTDGIVISAKKECMLEIREAMYDFELTSGFFLEETPYKAVYSESVNNYIAVKDNGKIKGKGAYAGNGLQKNPQFPICSKAVREWARSGTDVEQTIKECTDIKDFLAVRKVAGGAVWKEKPLGKVVRWYIGNDLFHEPIRYAKNGNKVPRTDGAIPMMDLIEELPSNLNIEFYINTARKMIRKIGVE